MLGGWLGDGEAPASIEVVVFSRSVLTALTQAGASMKFRTGEHAVYPGCGVGKIDEIQSMDGADMYVISFPDNKTRVWVPTQNAQTLGLRPIMTNATL